MRDFDFFGSFDGGWLDHPLYKLVACEIMACSVNQYTVWATSVLFLGVRIYHGLERRL